MPNKFFKIILLSVTVTVIAGCATTGKNRFKDLFDDDLAQNRQSIKFGSIPKAIGELSMLLEMDPKNEEARFLRALAYQKMEHFDKAASDYTELLKHHKDNSKAHYNLAMIYAFKIHDRKSALRHFDEFITLEPNHPRIFTAAKIMLQIDKTSPDKPENIRDLIKEVLTDRELSRIPEEDSGKKEALKKLEKAVELKPTCAKCHRALAEMLKNSGRKEEAEIHLVKAELFDPNHSAKE
jgi:Flp pilus assembly protein TadD